MTCQSRTVLASLVASGEAEADIAAVIKAADAKDNTLIEFWRSEGDTSDTSSLDCSNVALVYNPKAKQKQLGVYARLDPYGTFENGYDLETALGGEIDRRIHSSKRDRRNSFVLVVGAMFMRLRARCAHQRRPPRHGIPWALGRR